MKNLNALREKANTTQQQMADYLGVTRQCYQRYEAGQRQPDIQTLKKLSDYFNVSVDYLIGNSTDPRKSFELTKQEVDWLKLLSELKANCGDEAVSAVETLISTFIKQNQIKK